MRRYSLPLAGLAALTLMLNQPVAAQDGSDKNKSKIKQYDEIIIRKKSDKDGKVVVEIKDGNVTINGKPLDDFEDENLSVRRGRPGVAGVQVSPFRSNGGGWNFSGDAPNFNELTNAPFLGVATEDSKQGAIVEEVTKGSAAEKAGLKKGDVITKIGDDAVFTHDEVTKAVKKHKPEDKVTVVFKRDGKEQKATVTLGKRSSAMSFGGDNNMFAPNLEGLQGLQGLRNFDFNFDDNGSGPRVFSMGRPRLGIRAQDTEDGKGVKVLEVDDESIAEKAGIKEDDIITEFDGKTVNSADELSTAARESREKPSVTVKLTRDGKTQSLELKTPKKLKTANL
ncbi:PDZ domain-containing protein [Paraflavitalea pollutisoli]|uniref:PDZ domain-containing protein n=1 Tax=Paraflavitalea pollutisoli TaxID=3034143 RepID=UPI0023EC0E4C|nr:PDZ domain-containing protein [Paraflavitalea sp. H1-2-19X]